MCGSGREADVDGRSERSTAEVDDHVASCRARWQRMSSSGLEGRRRVLRRQPRRAGGGRAAVAGLVAHRRRKARRDEVGKRL